jgi:hypothetical protein
MQTFEQMKDTGRKSQDPSSIGEAEHTKKMERVTSRLPSDTWLYAAGASVALSLGLQIAGRKDDAIFVGQWAPTLLLMGVYNKLVKTVGSERQEHQARTALS